MRRGLKLLLLASLIRIHRWIRRANPRLRRLRWLSWMPWPWHRSHWRLKRHVVTSGGRRQRCVRCVRCVWCPPLICCWQVTLFVWNVCKRWPEQRSLRIMRWLNVPASVITIDVLLLVRIGTGVRAAKGNALDGKIFPDVLLRFELLL
jgi:hypothetical protein